MVTASLTTIPQRQESLKDTVESLLPQVDKLNIYLHGYTSIPDFLKDDKIEIAMDLEWGDHGDLDKFHWCKDITEGYHLICDDDLIYPADYAKNMLEGIDRYDKKDIVTFHGCIPYKLPIASYYDDRIVYPCLDTVNEDKRVFIPGTGVMGYHVESTFRGIGHDEKMPNMADVHTAVWAGENNKDIYVLKHNKDWIKHSQKVDLNDTIFAKQRYNTFEQVKIINSRPDIFSVSKGDTAFPLVSIVVVNTRLRTHPHYVKDCYDSIRNQFYPNIEPIIVDNLQRTITIGKAFNKAVEKAQGKYVFFLGDDDFINEDYIVSLVSIMERVSSYDDTVKGITSYLTMFNTNAQEHRELTPTGMWLREFLLENKFKEYLTKLVDSEFIDRIRAEGYKLLTATHNYGYFYRSHPGQVSGFKSLKHQMKESTAHNIEEFHQTVKEFE